ncbi:MAG: PqqD family protein [Eubacterium sp.]|nr:PqqD family protein [Eubacterium sp.]
MKNSNNYLDNIPKTNKKWEETKEGVVEITVENKGVYHKIAQKIFKKPRYSYIKLDEFGSCVWMQIDGEKTIYEIGQILKTKHEKAAEQLYERLSKFIGILEHNNYIVFTKKQK